MDVSDKFLAMQALVAKWKEKYEKTKAKSQYLIQNMEEMDEIAERIEFYGDHDEEPKSPLDIINNRSHK